MARKKSPAQESEVLEVQTPSINDEWLKTPTGDRLSTRDVEHVGKIEVGVQQFAAIATTAKGNKYQLFAGEESAVDTYITELFADVDERGW